MFLSRGSLSPKHYGESCWLLIKRNYDSAWRKYMKFLTMLKNGEVTLEEKEKFPFMKTMHHTMIENHERTQGAMARHFKEMKDRCSKGTAKNFTYFLREWETVVRSHSNILISKTPSVQRWLSAFTSERKSKA